MTTLEEKILRCRRVIETEYFIPETNLIYDFRTSLDHEHRFDHLPSVGEIAARLPNPCGWGSGMEDSTINGGVALDMYIDAGDAAMADKIYRGLRFCGTVSGVPGFVARSVSPRDGKSFYPESSRDQYTHYVYGLWAYFHSGMIDAGLKAEIAGLLVDVAKFCEQYVTEANDWTLPRADFDSPRSSVCKLWNVNSHEAARLPMFYAAAWSVSGDSHWLDMTMRYAAEAAEASRRLGARSYHSYALLQMICSCRLLHDVLPDARLKACYAEAMRDIAEYLNFNMLRAADASYAVDYHAQNSDWRRNTRATVLPGCRHVIPAYPDAYALAARNIREIGEVLLIKLLLPGADRRIGGFDTRLFAGLLADFEPESYMPYGALYPAAAWYKAKKLGIEF